MKDVVLNGAAWSTKDDVYDAFFRAVGAPEWHGRNFDALRDSIAGGEINKLVLSKGSFEVNVGGFGATLDFPVNPKTCSSDGSATAQVPIVDGTGTRAYKGISGTIDVTVSIASIVPRLASRDCNTNATRYPGVLIASGTGTVSYK